MIVGIHQLNFAPWMGYFNKVAKSDIFILLDEVQITFGETMNRNRILNSNGDIFYLSVPCVKKDHLQKKFYEIEISDAYDWQHKQKEFLRQTYGKFEFYNEVMEKINFIFNKKYEKIIDVNADLLKVLLSILDIKTKLVYQSELNYDRSKKKNDLVLELCKTVKADIYLSGNGARDYMDLHSFDENNIHVMFQTFTPPFYDQKLSKNGFIPGLSILDTLFNIGVEQTKVLFWNNVQRNEKVEVVL